MKEIMYYQKTLNRCRMNVDKLNVVKQSLEATIKQKDTNIEEMKNQNKVLLEANGKMKNRDKQLEMRLERRDDQIKELRSQIEKQKAQLENATQQQSNNNNLQTYNEEKGYGIAKGY